MGVRLVWYGRWEVLYKETNVGMRLYGHVRIYSIGGQRILDGVPCLVVGTYNNTLFVQRRNFTSYVFW